MKKRNKKRSWVLGVVLVFGLGAISFTEGYFEVSKNLDVFVSVYKNIHTYYVDDTNPGELIKTGIDAMLEGLDPYTVYYPESDIEDYKFMTTGQYGGIGAVISKKDSAIYISEPYENFPAQKAGLLAGDRILKVDGKSAEGKTTQEISDFLKGEPNTKLVVTVQRYGIDAPMDITVIREEIKIKDVPYYGVLKNNLGYIKLNGFTETASTEVRAALEALKKLPEVKGVVLDLRGNGGGLLREAVNIVGLFVPKGTKVVETKGKIQEWNNAYFTQNEPVDVDLPLIVCIDGGSASASEIVAGTIQDLDRGVIIGQNSFGKGLVQQTRDLKYNAKMKLTVAKYYIPSGRCIQKLDYAHKDANGKAQNIPDSLRKEFTTLGGRKVLDGDGIEPDILVDLPEASNIFISLIRKQLFFDYATKYRVEHDSISNAFEFRLSADDYEAFKSYLVGKDYSYTTQTESLLKKLEKAVEEDQLTSNLKDEFEALELAINTNKSGDLDVHKEQIAHYLENEIVSRYYFQTGRLEQSFGYDAYLDSASILVLDTTKYQQILTAK